MLAGGTGTGKSDLATTIGVSGIQYHGKRTHFFSTVDLVNMLELEKTAENQGRLALSLMQIDLVILDAEKSKTIFDNGGNRTILK